MYYTTNKFSQSLIDAVVNYMNENLTKVLPLSFLVNRSDYNACRFAKIFWDHGYRYFTVNENNELVLHGVWDHLGERFIGKTFEWIIVNTQPGYEPETIHHRMLTEDLLALVQIAYDTIGSPYFEGRGSNSWCDTEDINAIEAEYEARRNEI